MAYFEKILLPRFQLSVQINPGWRESIPGHPVAVMDFTSIPFELSFQDDCPDVEPENLLLKGKFSVGQKLGGHVWVSRIVARTLLSGW